MEWTETIRQAIAYIEGNITQELTLEDIARQVHTSPFYFQKGFSLLCGFTVAEYVRKRRLALAGSELVSSDEKVIDVALKYGYDSPDSFTKAFTRFHGITPAMAKREGATLKSFAPLKIKIWLEGGYPMEYKIMQKDQFTLLGVSKVFKYDTAKAEIPKFWAEHYATGRGNVVYGMYGISYDKDLGGDEFEYLIADNYNPTMDVPEGFVTQVIPAFTWAVFPCKGALPEALQGLNDRIFSEWLPACKDYEIAAGYSIEMYNDPTKYPGGMQDENYCCEIWIPVKKR